MIRLNRAAALSMKGAHVRGNGIRLPCPVHGGKSESLSLGNGKKGHAIWNCFAGCDPDVVRDRLIEAGVLIMDKQMKNWEREQDRHEQDVKRKLKWCRAVYEDGSPIAGPDVRAYLIHRGVFAQWRAEPPLLRFPMRNNGAQIFAPVTDAENRLIGLHITTIRPDGSKERKCHGQVKGGAIRLGGNTTTGLICIAEGIETAYAWAAMNPVYGGPTWSVISANGIASFEPPKGATCINVAADFDGASITGFERLARRRDIQDRGITVKLLLPEEYGTDFNDLLLKRLAAA